MTVSHRPQTVRALTGVDDLIAAGLSPRRDRVALQAVAQDFRVRITPAMQAAIVTPDDPVARQFVPLADELNIRPGDLADPIGDHAHMPVTGLTHRYPDRVILAVTQSCEVYCRFCFRRETVGDTGVLGADDLAQAYEYLRATPSVTEVILTGGDPLMLSPRRIAAIVAALSDIPHIDVIRFHSRIPVVAPQRIDAAMLAALQTRATVYVVVHANHAQELTEAAQAALARLSRGGIPLLSQTVLLKGVNDTVDALTALFRALVRHRVTPYYLHHCDLARGTGHFRTTIADGQRLMAALRGRLSGICLPTYVLDIPGGFGKMPIGPAYLTSGTAAGQHWVRDYQGGLHAYADPAD